MKLKQILNENQNISKNTDKHTTHDYINGFYEEAFSSYKDKKINLLEIGICTGGSIALWEKYFDKAEIYAADIVNDSKIDLTSERIKLFFQNAYDESFLDSLPNFDIIIDDGPHTLESMEFVVKNYSKKLNKDGLIVIEDIQHDSWFNTLIKHIPENFEYAIVDLRRSKGRYDDLMFILRHKT